MESDPKSPPETWSAITLRDPEGYFVARGITWSVTRTPSVFHAETWSDTVAMEVWLADRLSSFRRQVLVGDFRPVRLTCRVGEMPERIEVVEPRPMVAEAAGFQ